jgi:hypothetical protein
MTGTSSDDCGCICTCPSTFMRSQILSCSQTLSKAAAARFVQDDVDNGLPLHTMYERKVADRALEMPDLPLYHVPS